ERTSRRRPELEPRYADREIDAVRLVGRGREELHGAVEDRRVHAMRVARHRRDPRDSLRVAARDLLDSSKNRPESQADRVERVVDHEGADLAGRTLRGGEGELEVGGRRKNGGAEGAVVPEISDARERRLDVGDSPARRGARVTEEGVAPGGRGCGIEPVTLAL